MTTIASGLTSHPHMRPQVERLVVECARNEGNLAITYAVGTFTNSEIEQHLRRYGWTDWASILRTLS